MKVSINIFPSTNWIRYFKFFPIQIYSRTPNPGPEFIAKYKNYLGDFGYDPDAIKDTPQDCEGMTSSQLALMMSMPGMEQALTNQFPDLGLKGPVAFDPFSSVFETLKKLVELYFKNLLSWISSNFLLMFMMVLVLICLTVSWFKKFFLHIPLQFSASNILLFYYFLSLSLPSSILPVINPVFIIQCHHLS